MICGVIILNNNYEGEDFEKYYYQDALTGKILSDEVKLNLSINAILNNITENDNFENLNNELSERLRNRSCNQILDYYLEQILNELKSRVEKGEIQEKDVSELYVKKAAEVVAWLTVHKFPYILGDETHEENDDYNFIHSNFRLEIVDDFIKQHNHLIGKRFRTALDEYTFETFHKEKVKVKRDKFLIELFCVLKSLETDEVFYVPVHELFQQIKAAMEQSKSSIK